jgi:hypothetical protein
VSGPAERPFESEGAAAAEKRAIARAAAMVHPGDANGVDVDAGVTDVHLPEAGRDLQLAPPVTSPTVADPT